MIFLRKNLIIATAIFCLFPEFSGFGQNRKIDSLKILLTTTKEDTSRVNLLNSIGSYYRDSEDTVNAFNYLKNARDLSRKLGYNKGLAQSFIQIAGLYNYCGDFENSLRLLDTAQKINSLPLKILINAKSLKANVLVERGKFEEALKIYLGNLKLLEGGQDYRAIVRQIINISVIFKEQDNKDLALHYALEALSYEKKIDHANTLADIYTGVSNAYFLRLQDDSALYYALRSHEVRKKIGEQRPLANSYYNLGVVYFETGHPEKALPYLNEALRIRIETNDAKGIANTYLTLSLLHYNKKEYNEALTLIKKGFPYVLEGGSLYKIRDYYERLADVYSHMKLYEDAYEAEKSYSQYKDSVLTRETLEQITEMQTKYETEKKENLLKLSALELEEQKQRSFYTSLAFAVIFFITVLGGWFFYYRYRSKQKIKFETEMRRQDALRYEAVIETLEKERSRIGKELHDNTGALVSYIISKTDFIINNSQNSTEEIKTVKSSAQEVMTSLRETLWTLNNNAITNHDLIDKLKVYIKKHLLISNRITDRSDNEYILPNDAVLSLFRCAQEIINNINKHSHAKNVIIIFSSCDANKFDMMIEDDGIGFEENEQKESYGLRNLRSRLAEINARLDISSLKNNGTSIHIKYN